MENKIKSIRTQILIKVLCNIYRDRLISEQAECIPLTRKKNILVIAPHADDEIIGCAGFIQECIKNNIHIYVLCVTVEDERSVVQPTYESGENIRILECNEVKKFLGYNFVEYLRIPERSYFNNQKYIDKLKCKICELMSSFDIDTVFIPNYYDKNPDHRYICSISIEAIKDHLSNMKSYPESLKSIFLYEVWGPTNATHYYALSNNQYQNKLISMGLYKTQMNAVNYCQIIETINRLRVADFKAIRNKKKLASNHFDYMEFFEKVDLVNLNEYLISIQKEL